MPRGRPWVPVRCRPPGPARMGLPAPSPPHTSPHLGVYVCPWDPCCGSPNASPLPAPRGFGPSALHCLRLRADFSTVGPRCCLVVRLRLPRLYWPHASAGCWHRAAFAGVPRMPIGSGPRGQEGGSRGERASSEQCSVRPRAPGQVCAYFAPSWHAFVDFAVPCRKLYAAPGNYGV
jgi:hypothetical protein